MHVNKEKVALRGVTGFIKMMETGHWFGLKSYSKISFRPCTMADVGKLFLQKAQKEYFQLCGPSGNYPILLV